MSQTSDNNKRIAKNVSFLYIRMIFLLIVGLYTSRVVLNAIGVVDYGIYNVVGGVVAMFSFINGSMGTATTRFLTFELGKHASYERMRLVFSTALLIHLGICCLILVLGETIGLWYVYNVLVVPSERFEATLFVYQFSLVTTLIGIISVPYNASLVAHEKMGAFAYISILEATSNLFIALVVKYVNYDKLIIYGILLMLLQVILRLIYGFYCSRHFQEISGKWMFDKAKFLEMGKFALWIMNGSLAVIGYTQGLNLILNYFFGPAVNAARAVAVTVQLKVSQFCTNFQMAVNPQITKSYASKDYDYMYSLINNTSKYSFYLVFLLSFPIIVEADSILKIWLGTVPKYATIFVQLTLFIGLVESLRMPMNTAIHSTGKIKKFQIYEGGASLLILPLALLFLYLGFSPVSVLVVQLAMFIIIQIIRILIVCPAIGMEKKKYLLDVVLPIFKVVMLPFFVIPLLKCYIQFGNMYINLCFYIFTTIILSILCIYYIGLDRMMRDKVLCEIKKKIKGKIFR